MIRWYHCILSAYGFWLPNDPRGSWSDFVASWELYRFGSATKTDERRSLAKEPHDVQHRRAAKSGLKYPPVRFDAAMREAVGAGFAVAVREGQYAIHACYVGYDHCHLVIARHDRTVEMILGHLRSKATMELNRREIHPLRGMKDSRGKTPTPWGEGEWKVFIDDVAQARNAVSYVERHPMKEGIPEQRWDFTCALRA